MTDVSPDATADIIRLMKEQQERLAQQIAALEALVQDTNRRFTEHQRLVEYLLERMQEIPLPSDAPAALAADDLDRASQHPEQPVGTALTAAPEMPPAADHDAQSLALVASEGDAPPSSTASLVFDPAHVGADNQERIRLPELWMQSASMAQAVTEAVAARQSDAEEIDVEAAEDIVRSDHDVQRGGQSTRAGRRGNVEGYIRVAAIAGTLACAGALAAWLYGTVNTPNRPRLHLHATRLPATSSPVSAKLAAATDQQKQAGAAAPSETPSASTESNAAQSGQTAAAGQAGVTSTEGLNLTLLGSISRENRSQVDALLASGADVNALNDNGSTALMLAARLGDVAIVKDLLAHHADIDAHNPMGWTALMLAARMDHPTTVQALLDAGANIDARNNNDTTALMMAAQVGAAHIVEDLSAHNADLNARNKDGMTALMLALQHGHRGIASMLRHAGEKE